MAEASGLEGDDPAFAMYFIATGTVEVDVPGQRVRLGEGAFFGEMAVLRKGRRSADVVALSQCRLLVLEAADLHMLMAKQSTLGAHIRAVAEERLRRKQKLAGALRICIISSPARGPSFCSQRSMC